MASADNVTTVEDTVPLERDPITVQRCCPCQSDCFRRSNFYIGGLILFMVGYLAAGALIFGLIEAPKEKALQEATMQIKDNFLDLNSQCLDAEELESFMREILNANDRGIRVIGNSTSQPNWSFGQAFFFAGTVLTTIGYGHVAPLSEGGKVFCIIYALVGIPLTLIMFSALVERIMIIINRLLKWLTEKLGHLYKTFYIRLLHLTIVVIIGLTLMFLIPATVFMFLEDEWNYLDSVYYCFISMTTIGLGDYIPGEQPHQEQRMLYKICTTFYLFLGLVLMMTVLATIYEVQELNIGFHFYLKSDEEEEERIRLKSSSDPVGSKYGTDKASINSQSSPQTSTTYTEPTSVE